MASLDISTMPPSKKKKKAVIPQPKTPMNMEQELEKFLNFLARSINQRFQNQVLGKLTKKDIEGFKDHNIIKISDISYSAKFNKLVKEFEKSINKQFSNQRISTYIKNLYKKTNKYNDNRFYKKVNSEIGVDVKSIIKTDGLNSFVNSKSLETTGQIFKTKSEMMENLSQNALRLLNAGKNIDTLREEVSNQNKKNLNKSELVARNEIKAFNSQLAKKRAENLGITKAIWRTAGGSKVRPCHQARNGKEYTVGEGLYSSCDGKTIEPSEEINCRCRAEYVVEFD